VAAEGDRRRCARLDLPVVDVIELRNGKVGSLQMFPADTATLLEFLRAGGPQARPG